MGLYIGTTPIKKVFVADGSGVVIENNKTVSPTESQLIVTPDTNYDALAQVTVNAVSSSYVGSGITRRDGTSLSASGATVTVPSGYYGSSASKSVDYVTLPTATESSATSGYVSKATVSRSTSDQYINIPTGYNSAGAYYKVNAVANGTEGTPTATKGTVSNHSVSVTPSVTNTAGYISGGSHTGTAVTVSASELVSGSETKTSNGTYDVTNLAQLIVNVSGGGGGNYPWFGPNTIKDYTKTITINLKNDTSWDSWTASTTATSILAAPTTNDFTYSYDRDSDVVFVVTTVITNFVLKSSATKVKIPISTGRFDFNVFFGLPDSYSDYKNLAVGKQSTYSIFNNSRMYYYYLSGIKEVYTVLYGVYPNASPSFSQSASGSTVTISGKRSAIYARCNTTYFDTARKEDVDSSNTNVVITFDVYKTPREGSVFVHGFNDMFTAMNAAPEA